MKIGIVTTWFERGAAYVSRQYMLTLEQENEVFIYARGGESYAIGDPVWDTPNVTWGIDNKSSSINTWIDKNHFLNWIENNEIQLVFFNEQWWFAPIIWCKNKGIKTGAYIDYYKKHTVSLFHVYDFLICNTKRHFSVFSDHPQSFYIPWGADINLFKPLNLKSIDKNFITFFHSAGMNPSRKGTDILLKSFSKIRKHAKLFIHTQVDLLIFFPELQNILDDLLSKGKLEIYNGTVSAPGLYEKGDVYVYPTRLEGIGLTIAEAICSGLPVIVPNCPPMNEFCSNQNGKLIEIDYFKTRSDNYYWPESIVSEESLTNHLEFYIDNFSKIINMKKDARNYALKNLNWLENSKNILNIFPSVIQLRTSRSLILRVKLYDLLMLCYPYIYKLIPSILKTILKRVSTFRP